MAKSRSKAKARVKPLSAMTPEEVWQWYQDRRKAARGKKLDLTADQLALVRLAMKVREHRNAIDNARGALDIMGERWVDQVIAYHAGCLVRLGVLP